MTVRFLLAGTLAAALLVPASAPAFIAQTRAAAHASSRQGDSPRTARRGRRCGTIGSSAGWGYSNIRAYGLTCRAAKHVLNTWSVTHPGGWKLTYGGKGGVDSFTKGRKKVTGQPLGD